MTPPDAEPTAEEAPAEEAAAEEAPADEAAAEEAAAGDTAAEDTAPDRATSEEPAAGEPTPEERRALFRVVRGEPTDAEVAALTVVLAAVAAASAPAGDSGPRSRWADRPAGLRAPITAGADAWRTSTWPR